MALKDYKPMQERCSNCSFCKWIPFDKVKSARFAENCPSVGYGGMNTYSARGRFQLGLAVANGELDYTEKMAEVARDCLACGACDVACKICRYNLEPLDHNLELKHDAILAGKADPKQQAMIKSLRAEKTLIPGCRREDRCAWADGLGLKDLSKETAEYAYFPGCKYSYDKALQPVTRGAAKLLLDSGVDLGCLGAADMCCGGRARQMGFFEAADEAADRNIAAFEHLGVKTVVTPCADCYHALKRDYAARGSSVTVLHTTELFAALIAEGRLRLTKPVEMTVTYHDPCHLGRQGEPYVAWNGKEKKILNQIHTWDPRRPRYNGAYGIYDAPRAILLAIPGLKLVEMERIREYSWCCGNGANAAVTNPEFSAWTAGERLTEARATGCEALVTACPWCESVLSAAKDENGNSIPVLDITELILRAL